MPRPPAPQPVPMVTRTPAPAAPDRDFFEPAAAEVPEPTTRLLAALPPRRHPPKPVPPLRRPEVIARLAGAK
ncbi:DUF2277 family protein [Mycobacterium avium]|uniref:DUF2277 family protein n=1 Tax=Mycobacterium avium TaxID=1764 RepID=UPI0007A0C114